MSTDTSKTSGGQVQRVIAAPRTAILRKQVGKENEGPKDLLIVEQRRGSHTR